METWELGVREQIRHTIARYTVAGDGFRLEDLAALFTEDGVLHVHGAHEAHGRDAIVAMLSGTGERREATGVAADGFYIRHFVTNVLIQDVTPEHARASSYFAVLTPKGLDHWGRYRDEFVPDGGEWRFRHRFVRVDTAPEGSWAAHGMAAE